MKRLFAAASLSVLMMAACQQQQAAEPAAKSAAEATQASNGVSGMAPAFTLVDAEGVQRSLADYRGKTVILEWSNEGCPYVKKHYTGAMQALQREATGDGIVWLTIISSAPGTQGFVEGETARNWKTRFNASHTHLLLDPTGQVGRLYDAKTTPDMRIIGPDGRILYAGAIDDRPTNKPEDLEGANNYVRAALTDIDAGRAVATPYAVPYGCSVKYADEQQPA
jgi:peroxiredoxin